MNNVVQRPSWTTPPSHHQLRARIASTKDAHYGCAKCSRRFSTKDMLNHHLRNSKPSHRKTDDEKLREHIIVSRLIQIKKCN